MPAMLMPSWAALPATSCQLPNTAATATLPDAGIVVTEMKTPTIAMDLELVMARTPAAAAITATINDHQFGV